MEDANDTEDKKPYEAPAIEESAPFEQLRLSCQLADQQCYDEGGPVFSS